LPQAWFLAGWLAASLGWRCVSASDVSASRSAWTFESDTGSVEVRTQDQGPGIEGLSSVTIAWDAPESPRQARFRSPEPGRLTMSLGGEPSPSASVAVPQRSRAALVSRQLPTLRRDELFVRILATARAMAEALSGSS
jgi:glucose-6-phosphate dehydrogenase assembly protein OpcA